MATWPFQAHEVDERSGELFFETEHQRNRKAAREVTAHHRVGKDTKGRAVAGGGVKVEENDGTPRVRERVVEDVEKLGTFAIFGDVTVH